jgi:hypothetical protein
MVSLTIDGQNVQVPAGTWTFCPSIVRLTMC